ncbi:hypothetical protein F2Q70_00030912 [Brassica cretica]|uniref:Uncharacterized protein n=1 Tax=Brassica cretica TaxID=69181 RepID=A0A8S9FMW6_BRACR|nr:hypothetical protein F2Q70_00030912 [Brassica cretica]
MISRTFIICMGLTSVVLDLVGTHETPETMRKGYYGAYLSFFHSCGLTFLIPEPILEVLAELGLSLTQLLLNFLRHLVAFLVKAREDGLAFGYVVTMEDHVVASRNDKEIESIGFEIKRLSKELEATKREGKKDAENIEALTEDWRRVHLENETLTSQMVAQRARIAALEVERHRDIRRASRIARRDIAAKYREVLEFLNDRWASKKKEVSAEIRLQEVTANIDLLNELKDGGLTVDAELARLKGMEGDCEDLVALAVVPDWSISELDLPQVSDDSVDQVGGSSVPDDSVSS